MAIPSLLLSPDGSRDRDGPVTPTVDSSVSIVDGQYGKAWRVGGETRPTVSIPYADYASPEFTLIARLRFGSNASVGYPIVVSLHSIRIGRDNSGFIASIGEEPFVRDPSGSPIPDNEWVSVAISRGISTRQLYRDGVITAALDLTPLTFPNANLSLGQTGQEADVESVLIFPEALSDADIHRISTMPEAWTWERLMPQIGGVRTVHDPAPFAVRSTHEEI